MMNVAKLSKMVRISVLLMALSVVIGVPVASAQNGNMSSGTSQTTRVDRDDDTNWGWIGLLGLLGLAGLMPKKRHVDVRDDNNRTTNM